MWTIRGWKWHYCFESCVTFPTPHVVLPIRWSCHKIISREKNMILDGVSEQTAQNSSCKHLRCWKAKNELWQNSRYQNIFVQQVVELASSSYSTQMSCCRDFRNLELDLPTEANINAHTGKPISHRLATQLPVKCFTVNLSVYERMRFDIFSRKEQMNRGEYLIVGHFCSGCQCLIKNLISVIIQI